MFEIVFFNKKLLVQELVHEMDIEKGVFASSAAILCVVILIVVLTIPKSLILGGDFVFSLNPVLFELVVVTVVFAAFLMYLKKFSRHHERASKIKAMITLSKYRLSSSPNYSIFSTILLMHRTRILWQLLHLVSLISNPLRMSKRLRV